MEHKKKQIILIIDPEEEVIEILQFSFEERGYHVHGLTTGGSAEHWLSHEKNIESLSAAIVERSLPNSDGLEICKLIQKLKPSVPFFILSARFSEVDQILGLQNGALDYISKPFSIPILIEKVISAIARSG